MKDTISAKKEFYIVEDLSILGFENEQFYKICQSKTGKKICNLNLLPDGSICVNSVYCAEANMLLRAIEYGIEALK